MLGPKGLSRRGVGLILGSRVGGISLLKGKNDNFIQSMPTGREKLTSII